MQDPKTTYADLEKETKRLITEIKFSGKENWEKLNLELDSKLKKARLKLEQMQYSRQKDIQESKDEFNHAAKELKDTCRKYKTELSK